MSGDSPAIAVSMARRVAERLMSPKAWSRLDALGTLLTREVITDYTAEGVGEVLADVEMLFTGWEAPVIDATVLARAPKLRAIVHAGGSVKHHVTADCWARGIAVSSAASANAVAVAEFTLGAILLGNKHAFELLGEVQSRRRMVDAGARFPAMGNYAKTVGIVGASRIGRHLIELLRPFAFTILVYDPYLTDPDAVELGVQKTELAELMSRSDVVTVHAPSLPETFQLITERLIARMRPGTLLINTARGELIDQDALTRRLLTGDITAILDVVTPWDLPPEHPLYELRNVALTPHIAGSLGSELHRLLDSALAEVARFVADGSFTHPVTAAELDRTA